MTLTSTILIGCIMLGMNFAFEYYTLTMRHGIAAHIAVRVATLAFYIAVLILCNLAGIGDSTHLTTVFGLVFFADCAYLFKESLPQKLFLFFMNWGITRFLASLCVWMASWLKLGGGGIPASSLLYIGSYLLLMPIYVKYWRKPIKESLKLFGYGRPIYAIFPLLAFLLLIMLLGPTVRTPELRSLILMLLFESLVIFTYYLLFAHVRNVYGRLQSEASLRTSKRQMLLQKRYYEEMEKGVHAQRKLLHDNRHHLRALAAFSSARDYEALDRYLALLLESEGHVPARNYCENSMANAIIGGYVGAAAAKGIEVNVDLDLPEGIGINEYDLCVFFGNTIENAVEACERIRLAGDGHGDRHIEIRSRLEGDCLVVRIENSFEPDPAVATDEFPSSKGELGGVGLESVRAIVDRYRGCLSFERQGRLFVLSALLYSAGRPEARPGMAQGSSPSTKLGRRM